MTPSECQGANWAGNFVALRITDEGTEAIVCFGLENIDPHGSNFTFSWEGGRARRISAYRWRRDRASCAGLRSSRRRLPACGRAYGTGAPPRFSRELTARRAFRKSAVVSFHERRPPAASSFLRRGGPDRHCCRGQKPAIDVPLPGGERLSGSKSTG